MILAHVFNCDNLMITGN